MNQASHKILSGILIFSTILSSTGSVFAAPEFQAALQNSFDPNLKKQIEVPSKKGVDYAPLMRAIKDNIEGKEAKISEETLDKQEIKEELQNFIESEEERLNDLGVKGKKQKKYFETLEKQIENLEAGEYKKEKPGLFQSKDKLEDEKIKIPENPAEFAFSDDKSVEVNSLKKLKATEEQGVEVPQGLDKVIKIQEAEAAVVDYPVLNDLAENSYITFEQEFEDIVSELEYNPVKITNFVRENISYEPYYGAKKGAYGCLIEQVCNDVDASSLTIALLRAAEIPARYKSSVIVMPVEQLQNLLGVDETKTVYAAFGMNKVPVYTVSGNEIGDSLDEADFSGETHLALEWVHVEAFYEYDERGANFSNIMSFEDIETDLALMESLTEYTDKQWIPIDTVVQPYERIEAEILAETASFDTEDFWYDFLEYQGDLDPIEKYQADLQADTGEDVYDHLSSNNPSKTTYSTLPITLPYLIGEGVTGGTSIPIEEFSTLPSRYRHRVTLSLKRSDNDNVLLEQTFLASEVNNKEILLSYEGATETDKQVIESYGGIHATPADLVDIRPTLFLNGEEFLGTDTAEIGDSLVLEFVFGVDNAPLYLSEKFSTAGNSEGIYLFMSKHEQNAFHDTSERIVFGGNTAMASEYLRKTEVAYNSLSGSLDQGGNIDYARAVITQNRVLSKTNGTPTTFEFSGLTIDAEAHITKGID